MIIECTIDNHFNFFSLDITVLSEKSDCLLLSIVNFVVLRKYYEIILWGEIENINLKKSYELFVRRPIDIALNYLL